MSNEMFYFVCVLVVEAIVILASIIERALKRDLESAYLTIMLILSAATSIPLAYNVWAALYDTNANDAGYIQMNGWLVFINVTILFAHMYGGYLWYSHHEPKMLNSIVSNH